MSETTEGVPAPEPEPTPAPESTPAETESPEQTPEVAEEERESRGDRRYAVVTAKLSAKEREAAALRAENEFYRRQLQQQTPEQDTPEQAAQRLRMQMRAEVEAEIKKDNFHAQGNAQFPDWGERTQRLMDMGADPGFALLLIDLPVSEAVKVAGALADDPEALQRIANLRGERARAVALGKYAAGIDDGPAAQRRNGAERQVTRAPAPIRPVTGRANPPFNEYIADGQTLVDRYMRENLEKRRANR